MGTAIATSASRVEQTSTSVSLVIPTYNERSNIRSVIDECLSALEAYDVEVLVVDDDSPDGTWQFVTETYADDPNVSVIRRTEERGLATAVTRGFQEATNDHLVVIDADLQHPPSKVDDLLSALEDGADIAVGSRFVPGGGIDGWSRYRKLVSRGAAAIAKLGVPAARTLADPMSGFFAVRASVVDGVSLDPSGYKILLEVLAKGDYATVSEVPYRFRERVRGESKLTASQYVEFLEHVLALAVLGYGDESIDPQRTVNALEFMSVGGLGVFVNTAIFMILYQLGTGYLVAGALAFFVAFNWNFVGNWSLTFDRPDGRITHHYWRFALVSATGFAVYTVLLTVLIGVIPALVTNLIAICGSSVFNFLGSEKVAFN